MEKWQRNFILLTGFLEALLFSGCLFGWPSLLLVLQREGIYRDLCSVDHVSMTKPVAGGVWLEELGRSKTMSNRVNHDDHSTANESLEHKLVELGCDDQRVQMTLIYTCAAVAYGITAVFIGASLEYMGLRMTRLVGSFMITAGFIFLAYTEPERSWCLWIALNLIALGSNQLRFSGFQFADLWPKYRATILTTYGSAYAVSTTFFLVVQLIYEANVSMRLICLISAAVSISTIFPTFLMPKDRIEDADIIEVVAVIRRNSVTPVSTPTANVVTATDNANNNVELPSEEEKLNDDPEQPENADGNNVQGPRSTGEDVEGQNGNTSSVTVAAKNDESQSPTDQRSKLAKIVESLCSLSGVLHMYWQFINLFLVLFYSSTFNIWAAKVTDDPDQVSFYIKMSGVCCLIAPLFIPLSGFVTDKMIMRAKKRQTQAEKLAYTMQAPTFSMAGATILLALTLTCKLFLTETAIYASLVLIALTRPAIVGSCTAYIRLRFPGEQFNMLNGIFTTVISIMCFVQYPVMKWMTISESSFIQSQSFLLVALVLSLASPCHMMIKRNIMKYAQKRLISANTED